MLPKKLREQVGPVKASRRADPAQRRQSRPDAGLGLSHFLCKLPSNPVTCSKVFVIAECRVVAEVTLSAMPAACFPRKSANKSALPPEGRLYGCASPVALDLISGWSKLEGYEHSRETPQTSRPCHQIDPPLLTPQPGFPWLGPIHPIIRVSH